jgi:hypothetical protein
MYSNFITLAGWAKVIIVNRQNKLIKREIKKKKSFIAINEQM